MKIEGYEEISQEEYNEDSTGDTAYFYDEDSGKYHYFKKAQKFPIVFEDGFYKIEVEEDIIRMISKTDNSVMSFTCEDSFPLLVKAVEKAKEVAKKNGT